MKRRNVLGLSGAGLIATVLPWRLARGFASREVGDLPALDDDLGRAIERGRVLGKPVIVFIVPTDAEAKWDRGEFFGDALHCGGDALLADLALAELVCASAADIAKRFREIDAGAEPLAYILELDWERTHIRSIDAHIEAKSQLELDAADTEPAFAKWVAPFVIALRAAVFRDLGQLACREVSARSSLDEQSIASADAAIRARTSASLALVDKCAALFRSAAESSSAARALWIPLLSQAARERLAMHTPSEFSASRATSDACLSRVRVGVARPCAP